MGKRQNENAQESKEAYNEREATQGTVMLAFSKAPAEVLKRRKIVRASATPSTTDKQGSSECDSDGGKGVFANISLLAGRGGDQRSTAQPVNHPVFATPRPLAQPPAIIETKIHRRSPSFEKKVVALAQRFQQHIHDIDDRLNDTKGIERFLHTFNNYWREKDKRDVSSSSGPGMATAMESSTASSASASNVPNPFTSMFSTPAYAEPTPTVAGFSFPSATAAAPTPAVNSASSFSFGAPSTTPASGLFGNISSSSVPKPASGLFGSSSSTPAPTFSFGTNSSTPAPTPAFAFGSFSTTPAQALTASATTLASEEDGDLADAEEPREPTERAGKNEDDKTTEVVFETSAKVMHYRDVSNGSRKKLCAGTFKLERSKENGNYNAVVRDPITGTVKFNMLVPRGLPTTLQTEPPSAKRPYGRAEILIMGKTDETVGEMEKFSLVFGGKEAGEKAHKALLDFANNSPN